MNTAPADDRLDMALALLERLEPGAPTRVRANLDEFDPDTARTVLGFAFADVVSRPGLDLRTREMLTVVALTAMGTAPGQLEFHVRGALRSGVSRQEIVEIVLQMAVYAGVPACMNGIAAAKRAFAAVESEGPAPS